MKKWWICLLAVLCLIGVMGCAEAEEKTAYAAVIANPDVADRLNVRKGPDPQAESLGRFYSGTPLTVLEETRGKDGEIWALVRIGGETGDGAAIRGYAMKKYLMVKNRNYGAPERFVAAETASGRIVMRAEPENDAEGTRLSSGEAVWILGDIGDDWRFVERRNGQGCGYVKTNQLKNRTIEIPDAYLIAADGGERVTVYADKELKKAFASFYSGAPVRVTDFNRAGWAKVQSYGTLYTRTSPGEAFVEGYVKTSELTVFTQPWEIGSRAKTGYALREISLPYGGGAIPRGAALTVAGEIDGQYQIRYNALGSALDFCLLTGKENVMISSQNGALEGPAALGYAWLPIPRDEEGYLEGFAQYYIPDEQGSAPEMQGFSSVCQVLAEMEGGWLQVRQLPENSFFVKKAEGIKIVRTEELYPRSGEKGPGAWSAEEKDAGLWVFTGKNASLRLIKDASGMEEGYASGGENAAYTVYIPAGTRVTMEGEGKLTPFSQDTAPILLDGDASELREDEPLFSGSGQFFCDEQIKTCHNYYDFRLRPVPGAEESWFRIGNLFVSPQEEEGGAQEEDEGYAYVSLLPGDMIEMHNCELYVHFGNG